MVMKFPAVYVKILTLLCNIQLLVPHCMQVYHSLYFLTWGTNIFITVLPQTLIIHNICYS